MVCGTNLRRQSRVCTRLANNRDDRHLALGLAAMASDLIATAGRFYQLPERRLQRDDDRSPNLPT